MRRQSWTQRVAANSQSKGLQRSVLFAMASGCAPDGVICLSNTELVRFSGVSKNGVIRAIRSLVLLDEIEVLDPSRGSRVSKYRIILRSRDFYHRCETDPPRVQEGSILVPKVAPFAPLRLYNFARAPGELQEDAPSAPAANPFDEPSPHLQEEPAIYAKVAFE